MSRYAYRILHTHTQRTLILRLFNEGCARGSTTVAIINWTLTELHIQHANISAYKGTGSRG